MTYLAASPASASIWAQPGTLGFLVVFGMGIILFFLLRSMSRHLRKVREAAALEAAQLEAGHGPPPAASRPATGRMRGPGGPTDRR